MSKFIALVDGSIYSKSVCDHAAWIAARTGSEVEILHVLGRRDVATAQSDLSGSIALGARTAILEELSALDERRARLSQQRGWAILDDAKALIEAAGIAGVTTRLRIGDLVEEVAACEAHADMVVIGKGLGGGSMPLAALIARSRFDVGQHISLGHYTHEKSPVACAAEAKSLPRSWARIRFSGWR